MQEQLETYTVEGARLCFDAQGGSLRELAFTQPDGSELQALHIAPWLRHNETVPETLPWVEKRLAGDFFCAPFGISPDLPIHGWTANARWQQTALEKDASGVLSTTHVLSREVNGARVTKQFCLRPGHPCLYQIHRFEGGQGHLPIAHHAMIHVPGGARLSFSQRRLGVTPVEALETDPSRGRSILAYPQRFSSLASVQAGDGTTLDATRYPFADKHEDIVILAGDEQEVVAWTAAVAPSDGFVFFALKETHRLPETILWMSNGGRDYAPWSGRHTAVLGIEEASTSVHANHQFGSEPGRSEAGLPMGLTLKSNQTQQVRYCLGAIASPPGWSQLSSLVVEAGNLLLQDVSGDSVRVPFDEGFFHPDGAEPS